MMSAAERLDDMSMIRLVGRIPALRSSVRRRRGGAGPALQRPAARGLGLTAAFGSRQHSLTDQAASGDWTRHAS